MGGLDTRMDRLAAELKERGLLEQEGGGKAVDFLKEKRTAYLGIDPTADSLHLGNLVPVIAMKHLANVGHELVFVVGGGTGMIGDPRESGERPLLDEQAVARNAKAIEEQLARVLGKKYRILNNYEWLKHLGVIEFLRDIGKHFTVNQLVKRDIVKRRLETEEDAISFTEFSYSLLQGYDFLHLNRKYGVDLQIGGSDQWANIISGVDLIRRLESKSAYALTTPIVVDKTSGKKFGKSEGNAVWLDPKKTSPFEFYQFWLNVADENIEHFLKIFTFLPLEEIARVCTEQREHPAARTGQKKLAHAVTSMVHGDAAAQGAEAISRALFGGGDLSKQELTLVARELPPAKVSSDVSLADAAVAARVAESKTEARRFLEGGALYLNGTQEKGDRKLGEADFKHGFALLRRGKKIGLLSRKKGFFS